MAAALTAGDAPVMQTGSEGTTAGAGTAWFGERLAGVSRGIAGGSATVVERGAPAGAMPPLHTRDRDESYLVLEGQVVFYVGAEEVVARAGDAVVAPRGVERTFRIESDRARWLVLTDVESYERYLDFLRATAQPDGGSPSEEEHAALTAVAAANGIGVVGPPGLLPRGGS